ncbi:hydrolase [Companilactobacillus suantsaicola]|uniref:hydrolase n=1 Tax=Companilactobacillus suantsaicola TaxID=2487723 RepID=UPI001FE3B715|nr:hydrolase [Companilactobacillus suantsaicola]
MFKQIKLEALLIISLIVTGGMGYTVAYAADSTTDQTSNATDFRKTLTNLETKEQVSENADKLNKKITLPDNKEFMPGIEYSEKDPNMGEIETEEVEENESSETSQVAITQGASEPPVEYQNQTQQTTQTQQTQQVQQTVQQPTTRNVGTFKISFYDPAVLGSNMGYSGVATNLGVIPRGSRLKITTAQGDVWYRTVNDTGTFAYSNPYQIDVAMPNSMIPSYGITSATVEIIG